MPTFYIALPEDAADRLRDLARRERRSPRQQAAVLVLAALDSEGTGQRPDDPPPTRTTTGRHAVTPERQP